MSRCGLPSLTFVEQDLIFRPAWPAAFTTCHTVFGVIPSPQTFPFLLIRLKTFPSVIPLAAIQIEQAIGVRPLNPVEILARAYEADGFARPVPPPELPAAEE